MAEGGYSPPRSSFSAIPKDNVDQDYLRSMMEMGIHRDDAIQALRLVNNRSLEDALAIIFGDPSALSTNHVEARSIRGETVEQESQYSPDWNGPVNESEISEDMMSFKMLFIVNGSLRMSSGKLAAQVAHSAIDLYEDISTRRLKGLNYWKNFGQTKIVVRAETTEEILELNRRATQDQSIARSLIYDAGRTEIPSGSITCLGLFGTKNQLDPITGHLKLMNDCLKCSSSATSASPSSVNVQQKQKTKKKANDQQSTTDKPTKEEADESSH